MVYKAVPCRNLFPVISALSLLAKNEHLYAGKERVDDEYGAALQSEKRSTFNRKIKLSKTFSVTLHSFYHCSKVGDCKNFTFLMKFSQH